VQGVLNSFGGADADREIWRVWPTKSIPLPCSKPFSPKKTIFDRRSQRP